MTIKQSICWGPFARGMAPEELIRQAAAIGYKSIEMCPAEHWETIHAAGLEIAIIGGHQSLRDGMNKRENHDRIVAELRTNIDKAAANRIPALIVFSGNRYGLSDEEGLANCAECLRRIVGYAEEKRVTLCMELLNSKVNHPDYQCDRTSWGIRLCREVGSPAFKLLYDIYHMQIMEGDLIRTITENIEYIGHFHTAGNPGRRDLDDEQEINYPAVMRAIAATGYAGYVGHEFNPKGDKLEAMRRAYEVCRV